MNDYLRILWRLHESSFEELRVRLSQKVNSLSERCGWSTLTQLPDDAAFFKLIDSKLLEDSEVSASALLEHFRVRQSPRFFPAFYEQEATVSELQSRFASQDVVERARRISDGSFDLLGFQKLNFGAPINWQLEPISGVVAPNKHWSQISYLDAAQAGDKKITWELNRHAYFSTLGRAYWRTHDERYAQTFEAHIRSWLDGNPPKMGINWSSSLEIALRAISWIWALHFFRKSQHLDSKLFLRILKFLYIHGRHLETYLSTYFSPNTHLTGEALGLFYLGTLLPEFRCAGRWQRLGKEILLEQLGRHVRADGVYFEQSSFYHRYTTDFYTHLLILSRENKLSIDPYLENRLQALLDHMMFITRPDGSSPLFGDDDGGRLVFLDEAEMDDFRSALSNGAALFQRSDYKYVALEAREETMWLLGQKGLEAFDGLKAHPPESLSRAFRDGGYYVMRDGWTPDSNYLLIDCGPHGALKHGHAHADALSIELAARGRTILVDPGTYTYTGSANWRDYFRSSAAHNTLTVDDESSSVTDGPFSWKHVADSEKLEWLSCSRFDFFEGRHSGYERLPSPVRHARSVLFIKSGYWVILDRVNSEDTHCYELNFHFAEGARPLIQTEAEVTTVTEPNEVSAGLEIALFGPDGKWTSGQGPVSKCYGKRVDAPVLNFVFQGTGSQTVVTFLLPRGVGEAKVRARRVSANRGQAFEILDGPSRDLLLLSEGQELMQAGNFASDFRLTWVRLDRTSESLEEVVALNGRRLSLAGQEIVASSDFINYLTAEKSGFELRGETDQIADWYTPLRERQTLSTQLMNQ